MFDLYQSSSLCLCLELELSNKGHLLEKESSLLLMAFLDISRPALACLLLWLALSQGAVKKGAKCKYPKVTKTNLN